MTLAGFHVSCERVVRTGLPADRLSSACRHPKGPNERTCHHQRDRVPGSPGTPPATFCEKLPLTEYLSQYGVVLLFIVVLFESTGLPLPGESLVMASGMLAGEGSLGLVAVLLAAFGGSVVGDNIGYFVGRRYGRRIVVRWGSKFGLGEERFAMVEERFENYGIAVVLIARFVIILRQLNGFVAGTMKMNWPVFLLYNSISAALWAGVYGGGAYFFGAAFGSFFDSHATWPVFVVAGLVCVIGCVGTYKFLFNEDAARERQSGRNGKAERGSGDEAKVQRPRR